MSFSNRKNQNHSSNAVAGENKSSTGIIRKSQAASLPIRPLNMGQNKGKFNQLKSLLQSSDRVQTSDDIAKLRAEKNKLIDPLKRSAAND